MVSPEHKGWGYCRRLDKPVRRELLLLETLPEVEKEKELSPPPVLL